MRKFILTGLISGTMAFTSCGDNESSSQVKSQDASITEGNCAKADSGYIAGCLLVREYHFSDESDRKISLFYQWKGEYDSSKETIVILNGGPGGSLLAFRKLLDRDGLNLNNFNVLLYDQRGVGRSSRITLENIEDTELDLYTTNDNVEDLLHIVQEVVKTKVIVFGHSYGASLAYKFASTHPDLVTKVIALNGSTDAMGNIMQVIDKDNALQNALADIDEGKLQDFLMSVQNGDAVGLHGETLIIDFFMANLGMMVSSYDGQMFEAKQYVESLITANENRQANPPEDLINEGELDVSELDEALLEDTNLFVNMNTICNDFITKEMVSKSGLSDDYTFTANMMILTQCGHFASEEDGFDTKDDLIKIKVPVLMMGGTHDPLVPLKAQERDYELLSNINSNVTFVVLEKTGHQIFRESPKCVNEAIVTFLGSDSFTENKKVTCSR